MTIAATATNVGVGVTLADLLDSWELSLKAANESPKTITCYLESGRRFATFLGGADMPVVVERIGRKHIELWLVELAKIRNPTTVSVRYRALQAFFEWALIEREVPADPMATMSPPFVPEVRVEVPSGEVHWQSTSPGWPSRPLSPVGWDGMLGRCSPV